jgi:hypothetical protein
MTRHRREVENRIGQLETNARLGEVDYILTNNAHARLRRRDQVGGLHDAVDGVRSFRATVLINALAAADNSRLHELAQAMTAGPVLTTPSPETAVTEEIQ